MHFTVGMFKPKKSIPGTDFSGTVEEIGEGVTEFKIGDRVWGFKDAVLSSQAEYLSLNVKGNIFKIPEGIDFKNAVASAEGAHYAYYFYNKVKDWDNCKVLVNGGTGAIGSAVIQMLKYKGAHVTASCREEHSERVLALGADIVIDYKTEDFTKLVGQFNYVFDAVGKSSFGACKSILKKDGVYISSELGPGNENIYLPLLTSLRKGKKVKFPLPLDVNESLGFISQLLTEGKFHPLIDKSYTLDEISQAYAYILSENKVGNVLIRFDTEDT